MTTLIIFVSFVVLAFLRIPIEIAIGIACVLAMLYAGFGGALYVVPIQIIDGVHNPALIAIPYFILAGNLMNVVGMTDRIFNFANALVGHFRAGLAQVNVLASMIFAGISGAALADVAGLGTVQVRAMRKRGYSAEFAAALSVAAATIGPLIPPSIALIIYAYLSGTSVARLFLAGLVPGLLIGLALMVFNRIVAERYAFPREPRSTLRHLLVTSRDGIAALVAPAIIVSSIILGYATATEAGIIACAYSILLGIIYRTLTLEKLWWALTNTVSITVVIMIIIGTTQVMGWLLAIERAPQILAENILSFTDSKFVFLVMLSIFLLIVGCLVESVPAKLILIPLLLPIIDAFDVDRVHFGIIITYNLLIGMATPPMGIGLYIISAVSGVRFERVTIAILPMLIPLLVVLILITFVPGLSLWLPNLIMGPR